MTFRTHDIGNRASLKDVVMAAYTERLAELARRVEGEDPTVIPTQTLVELGE